MTLEQRINLMPTNGLEAKLRPSFFSSLRRSLSVKVITYSLAAFLSLGVVHALSGCESYVVDADGDGFYSTSGFNALADCNDNNSSVYPRAKEVCNGRDDNCDGRVDEGLDFNVYYRDSDGDGFGDPASSTMACSLPPAYVTDSTDCDDHNLNINPGRTEIPYNILDDDCNSTTLDDDLDRDGYSTLTGTIDCNDADLNIHPGAAEVCNDVDDNCDGRTDEGVKNVYYRDSDGDGFGDPASSTTACSLPPGFVANNTDCNDSSNVVYPNAAELCDLVDNQCPGDVGHRMVDEGCLPLGLEGRIAFVSENASRSVCDINAMDADGSSRTNLTNNPQSIYHLYEPCGNPAWSPDGSKIAFSFQIGMYWGQQGEIYLINSDGSNKHQLSNVHDYYAWEGGGLKPEWSPDGSKIAFSATRDCSGLGPSIFTINSDGTGQTPIINYDSCGYNPPVAWSPDGSKIATLGTLYTLNPNGSWTGLSIPSGYNPAWSPDGSKIAFESGDEIYVVNVDGSNLTNLTNNPANDIMPTWSPDGTKIAFTSGRDDPLPGIYTMNPDGTDQTFLADGGSPIWSPDGTKIAFVSDRDGNSEIYVMNADGSNQTNISNNPAMMDHSPVWSP